jgi:hypothetical protein
MATVTLNIEVEQGASWKKTFTLLKENKQPKSLVGYTGKAQIRSKPDSSTILGEFVVTFVEPHTTGKVTMSLTPVQTLAFTFATASWDLFVVSPTGVTTKIVKGSVSVTPSVTRFVEPGP